MLPWTETWLVLLVLGAATFFFPSVGAALLISFVLFYIVRVAYNGLFLVLSFWRVLAEERSDWMGRLDDLAKLGGGAGFAGSARNGARRSDARRGGSPRASTPR